MTLSQSSSDMWSRNSSRVMPAQDTMTDGGREKLAYGRGEVRYQNTTKTQSFNGVCARATSPDVHLHLFQQAPGSPGLRHVSLEGSVVPVGRPFLAPRPA